MLLRSNSDTDLFSNKEFIDNMQKNISRLNSHSKLQQRSNSKRSTKRLSYDERIKFQALRLEKHISGKIKPVNEEELRYKMESKYFLLDFFTVLKNCEKYFKWFILDNLKFEADIYLSILNGKINSLLQKQQGKEINSQSIFESLAELEAIMKQFMELSSEELYLIVKNILISELNNIAKYNRSLCPFDGKYLNTFDSIYTKAKIIISRVTYKIDFYNIFINHLVKLLDDFLMDFLFNSNFSEWKGNLKFYKIFGIYYKLQNKFFKEVNNSKYSPAMNSISTKIFSFASYFLKNFHYQFQKDKYDKSEFRRVSSFMTKYQRLNCDEQLNVGFMKKFNAKFHFNFSPKANVNFLREKNVFSLYPFLYFNSLTIHWKEMYIEEKDVKVKCRICEFEILEKKIAVHSYICSQKHGWKQQVSEINKSLTECVDQFKEMLLNYDHIENDLNLSSPLLKKGIININSIANNFEVFNGDKVNKK